MLLATATVYIPTLNGGERLASCLESLEAQTVEVRVVVADNGPGQGSAELLRSRFPQVTRIGFGGHNLGFGAALNRAVAAHGEGAVIFLNDDTVAEPDFARELLETHDSGAEMVAAVLLRASAPDLIDSAGISCDRTLTAWDYLTGEPVARLDGATDPLGPTGGAALFDRAAYEEAGGFDERIFAYYEDLDLALRMRAAGHRCRLAPGARAIHESSATLGRQAAAKYRLTGFGRGYLLRKYGVMKHPVLAGKTLLSDGSAVLGQIAIDRTAAGAKGRIQGWRAARDVDRLRPAEDLLPASLARHLRVRLRRRRG